MALYVLVRDNEVSASDGLILFLGYVAYITYMMFNKPLQGAICGVKDDDLEAPQPSSASPKPEPPKRAQSLREKALSGGAEFITRRSRTAPTHSASERRSSGHVCVRAGKARRHRALPKRS